MNEYAQLCDHGYCVGKSSLMGEVIQADFILVENLLEVELGRSMI